MPSSAILVSVVLVLSCRQTESHTLRITDVDVRYTHATTVDVSNNKIGLQNIKMFSNTFRKTIQLFRCFIFTISAGSRRPIQPNKNRQVAFGPKREVDHPGSNCVNDWEQVRSKCSLVTRLQSRLRHRFHSGRDDTNTPLVIRVTTPLPPSCNSQSINRLLNVYITSS